MPAAWTAEQPQYGVGVDVGVMDGVGVDVKGGVKVGVKVGVGVQGGGRVGIGTHWVQMLLVSSLSVTTAVASTIRLLM